MVRRSFRMGLRMGLLIGVGVALVKTVQARRATNQPQPQPQPWQPIVDTQPPPAKPEPSRPAGRPTDEVGEQVMEPPPAERTNVRGRDPLDALLEDAPVAVEAPAPKFEAAPVRLEEPPIPVEAPTDPETPPEHDLLGAPMTAASDVASQVSDDPRDLTPTAPAMAPEREQKKVAPKKQAPAKKAVAKKAATRAPAPPPPVRPGPAAQAPVQQPAEQPAEQAAAAEPTVAVESRPVEAEKVDEALVDKKAGEEVEAPKKRPAAKRAPAKKATAETATEGATKPTEARAKATKATKATKKAAKQEAAPLPKFVLPREGVCPPTHPVKAKLVSLLFHVPGGLAYDRTRPDRCYVDAPTAIADGFTSARR